MKTKQHQAARAPLYAQGEPGGDGRPLVRLVELAQQEAQRQSLPFSEAARRIADALTARTDLALFKGGAAGFASEVHEQTYWGEGGRFVAASESARASVPAGAAEANPNALLAQMIRARQNAKGRPAGPDIKRYPLMGREGAMRAFLAASARAPGADDPGLANVASLAMLRADADVSFGMADTVDRGSIEVAGTSQSLRLVQEVGASLATIKPRSAVARQAREDRARSEFKRAKDPGEKWQPKHLAALLSQFEFLRQRGDGQLKSEDAHGLLGEIWGLTLESVRAYLTKARAVELERPKGGMVR